MKVYVVLFEGTDRDDILNSEIFQGVFSTKKKAKEFIKKEKKDAFLLDFHYSGGWEYYIVEQDI